MYKKETMKYSYKLFTPFAFTILLIFSCKKQEYYQINPNSPSVGTPALLLTNIQVSLFNSLSLDASEADRHLTYYLSPSVNINYNWTRSNFNNYDLLRQVQDLDSAAAKTGETNYRAIAKFFRAVCYTQLTEIFGDIPYSEAMKALNGITKPKYDAQKQVYLGILNDLETANTQLDASKGTLGGDIIFGSSANQILQWKKIINAYHLRVLIHLSKKEADLDLNIKQQFQTIVSSPAKYPLLASNSDNCQLVFNVSVSSNYYPTYLSNDLQTGISMEKGFIKILKDRNDPRLYIFAEPFGSQPANVLTSYEGVDAGLGVSAQQSSSGAASRIKKRYWNDQVNEPLIFLSYAEQEFLIAEAISRNWVTGSGTADLHYNNAVTGSMNFYGIKGTDISTYLLQPNVKYDAANALSLIITQKYISFFMNSGWEAFLEQRRTGIPALSVGPATQNGGQVPKRWMYPQGELTNNGDNLSAAVQSQFSGSDNINGVMWLLK